MTGNSVTLYKAPWNFSTLYQPYFMSDTARDSYLANLEHFNVPYNGNVNIHFDYNLELSVIIPIDFVSAVDYNFCSIVYNNRKFYCNILDYKQVSVGRTELQLRRHIISERTNYFQYFEKFQISRATFSENFSYGLNTKFVLPTMRTILKRTTPAMDMHTLNAAGAEITERTYYRPFYVLYLDSSVINTGIPQVKLYGQVTQYVICIIPAVLNHYTFDYPNINSNKVNYREEGYFTEGEPNYNVLSQYSETLYYDILNKLSPKIKAIELVFMPLSLDSDMLPYVWKKASFVGIDDFEFLILDQTKLVSTDSEGTFKSSFNEYFSFDIDISQQNLFCNLTLIFGIDENRLTIPIAEKKNSSGILEVRVIYLMDINGSSYQVRIVGDNNSVKQNIDSVKSFPFLCDYSFLLDQDANFDAQNKYYDAMTRNAKRQKVVGGLINAGTEFALGGTQLSFSSKMGQSGKMANTAMGIGNIIRGVGTVANMVNDVSAYEKERDLYRANEKAKPDQLVSGDNAYARGIEWEGQISYLLEIPFTEDYNSWLDDKETYGIECDIHRNIIDINEFLVNDKFFLQALPVKKDNSILQVQEYNEMYSLIKDGCRYFIVEEQESNKLDGGE